jgi:hypothetical protein
VTFNGNDDPLFASVFMCDGGWEMAPSASMCDSSVYVR